jgi:hypothetical protein
MRLRPLGLCSLLLLCASACGAPYDDEAPRTIVTLVPPGQSIHDQQSMPFELEGREVRLTHVAYGALLDCPSGCFSSHVCAIEDGADVSLFYATWNGAAEAPGFVEEHCPDLTREETWNECEPPGLVHPVTKTSDFRKFARSDHARSGPYRHCFNRYTVDSKRF